MISKHHATYFTGHEHVYNVSQPVNNTTPTGGSAYQVIVGAGGSPFVDLLSAPGNPSPSTPDAVGTKDISQPTGTVTALASDRLYSWATVSIYASGKAQLTTYGFDPSLTGSLKTLGTFTLPAAQ